MVSAYLAKLEAAGLAHDKATLGGPQQAVRAKNRNYVVSWRVGIECLDYVHSQ